MPHLEIFWTPQAEAKVAEHGVSMDEVEEILFNPAIRDTSRSSGLPVAAGMTGTGRWLMVVYEWIDEITVMPITAYEPER